jgi:hypothetical protein
MVGATSIPRRIEALIDIDRRREMGRSCLEADTGWLPVELDESHDSMKSAAISLSNLTGVPAELNLGS